MDTSEVRTRTLGVIIHQLNLNHSLYIYIYETEDMSSSQHVASDSDSEVYCDSVDQFCGEEVSRFQFMLT